MSSENKKTIAQKTPQKTPVKKNKKQNAESAEAVKPPRKKSAAKSKAKAKEKKAKPRSKKVLIIVESPAKAKTIEKYLGSLYTVKASMGHLIDLPKSRLAIDVDHDFEPEYITVKGRAEILNKLRDAAKNSSLVLLASDNDREGEAIAWHLRNAISAKIEGVSVRRINFNEITPTAIKNAVANPGAIDEDKVKAQKARRVIDRLVGYNLSPLLWKKIKGGLSAGRVQSVALRLICEREKEVESFIPEEYWTLEAKFACGKTILAAQLVSWKGAKPDLKNEAAVRDIIDAITGAACLVTDIRETDRTIHPKPPFTTSHLQQTAATRLGFTGKKTMQIAQQLYEGVAIGSAMTGLITYMRTDSTRISQAALDAVREWIEKHYPSDLPAQAVVYAVGKKAQDAHEAIRPTYVSYTPDTLKYYLNREQLRLYGIIWERFVASQMKNAQTRTISVSVQAGDGIFRITGTKIIERGFYNVLQYLASKEETPKAFPPLSVGDILVPREFWPEQHFTQGPARYTDASIVKTLEEKGIGRPSTYAPIISVLLDRYYVNRSNRQLVPTVLGRLISDMLITHFPNVVDSEFTAYMENKLDEVEESRLEWTAMIREFYPPFKKKVDEVEQTLVSFKGSLDEVTDKICEKCGKPMLKKLGRYGYFLACSGFPLCRNAKSIPVAVCPVCGGDVIARKTKARGKEFYGCANYPRCDFISLFKPIDQRCPQCGNFMVEKYDKKHGAHKACINPSCDYLHSPSPPPLTTAGGGGTAWPPVVSE